ncbi:hypothetical protein Pelo_13949 [Pelomyxa schiedti]|nr:hypothetical protein Pelo_13949 [Pelomyxa schiedti]
MADDNSSTNNEEEHQTQQPTETTQREVPPQASVGTPITSSSQHPEAAALAAAPPTPTSAFTATKPTSSFSASAATAEPFQIPPKPLTLADVNVCRRFRATGICDNPSCLYSHPRSANPNLNAPGHSSYPAVPAQWLYQQYMMQMQMQVQAQAQAQAQQHMVKDAARDNALPQSELPLPYPDDPYNLGFSLYPYPLFPYPYPVYTTQSASYPHEDHANSRTSRPQAQQQGSASSSQSAQAISATTVPTTDNQPSEGAQVEQTQKESQPSTSATQSSVIESNTPTEPQTIPSEQTKPLAANRRSNAVHIKITRNDQTTQKAQNNQSKKPQKESIRHEPKQPMQLPLNAPSPHSPLPMQSTWATQAAASRPDQLWPNPAQQAKRMFTATPYTAQPTQYGQPRQFTSPAPMARAYSIPSNQMQGRGYPSGTHPQARLGYTNYHNRQQQKAAAPAPSTTATAATTAITTTTLQVTDTPVTSQQVQAPTAEPQQQPTPAQPNQN